MGKEKIKMEYMLKGGSENVIWSIISIYSIFIFSFPMRVMCFYGLVPQSNIFFKYYHNIFRYILKEKYSFMESII